MSERTGQALPFVVITTAVLVSLLLGSLLGLGAAQRYRSDTVFSVARLEGDNTRPVELRRIADDLIVVSALPSVRQAVRLEAGVLPTVSFDPVVGTDEESEGVIRFSASHENPETAEALSRALASISVRFLVDGRSQPGDDALAIAEARTAEAIIESESLISPVSTSPISSWPAFVRSAVVAAMTTLIVAVALTSMRSALRARRARRNRPRTPPGRPELGLPNLESDGALL